MTIIVTGATGAIGSAAVTRLRALGHTVIGTSRRTEHEGFRPLDISSPSSIDAFVQGLEADHIRVDGLLNNAGTQLPTYQTTPEGFERVTATNYLGTYLLTRRLLPLMNPGAHVVSTVSLSCYVSHLDKSFLTPSPESYRQVGTYANSKMAVMLFAEELHRRYADRLTVHVTDPGIVNSRILHMDRWFDPLADLIFRPLCKTPQQGALPAVNALQYHAPEGNPLLLFRGRRHQAVPRRWQRPDMARWLWDETERLLNI
jgi:NAD(P)-dependent dehydrogenase (short-subunit alcohol dehydrogenase family)